MDQTAPNPEVLEKSTRHGIGDRPLLVDATRRFPWQLHGPFGFGRTFPDYLLKPLVREIQTLTTHHSRPKLMFAFGLRQEIRHEFSRRVRAATTQINSTPNRVHWPVIEQMLDGLNHQTFRPVSMEVISYDPTTRRAIIPSPEVGDTSWENRTLVNLLFDLMPHLTATELSDPGLGWTHLYRFHRAARNLGNYAHQSDASRRRLNTAWHLAVYEAALTRLSEIVKENGLNPPSAILPQLSFLHRLVDIAAQPAVV